MPNKPVRQNAKYKEQQYRKRLAAQTRTAGPVDVAELDQAVDAAASPTTASPLDTATVRYAPAGAATATRPAAAVRRPINTPATSALRVQRGRIATQMQQMNLTDEMEFIRSDIRRLLILAAASFAVLIVLAFIIQ